MYVRSMRAVDVWGSGRRAAIFTALMTPASSFSLLPKPDIA
jgi:hypothetical protein